MNPDRRKLLAFGLPALALAVTGCSDSTPSTFPKGDMTPPPNPQLPKDRMPPTAGGEKKK